ncbi:exported hypothetical protein [Burkholderiales bacterium]|nr:exported hypothetical protein [Burkholderiales bacterium]
MDILFSHLFLPAAAGTLPARVLPARARREFSCLFACAAVLLPACLAQAQGSAARPELVPAYLGYWPELIRSTVQDALAPVLSSVNDFLRPARSAEFGWGAPSHVERGSADAVQSWRDPGQAPGDPAANTNTLLLQRPALSLGYAGAGPGVGLMRFRIPWLVTPESAMRAVPTLSLASLGSLHMDLMAASIGGRSGASAAYCQLLYRF